MSVVLENTAFAADLALVLPQAFHKCFDKRDEWRSTLESALDFSTKSSLMDEATNKSVHLVSNSQQFSFLIIIATFGLICK